MSIVSDGVFCVGVELDGQRFREFSVRPARLGQPFGCQNRRGHDDYFPSRHSRTVRAKRSTSATRGR